MRSQKFYKMRTSFFAYSDTVAEYDDAQYSMSADEAFQLLKGCINSALTRL